MNNIVTAGPFTYEESKSYIFDIEKHIEPEFNSRHYRLLYDGSEPDSPVFYVRHRSWE